MTKINWNKNFADELPHLVRYAKALTRNRHLAEDLIQDCLERAWNKRRLWDRKRKLRPWLFTIMHNQYINQVKKLEKKFTHIPLDTSMIEENIDPIRLLKIRDLNNAMDKLSPKYRVILLLVTIESFSYKEVSEITNLPIGTVMSRLYRAREKLRLLMGYKDVDNVVKLK